MKMMVITPTLTPRIVNAERSLFARNVSNAIRADSLISSSRIFLYCQLPIADFQFEIYSEYLSHSPKIGNWQLAIGNHSALNASIGSNLAARHAGHIPLTIPTIDEHATPNTADVTLISNGNPISAEIT